MERDPHLPIWCVLANKWHVDIRAGAEISLCAPRLDENPSLAGAHQTRGEGGVGVAKGEACGWHMRLKEGGELAFHGV